MVTVGLLQLDVAVAVPVLAGIGFTLQEIFTVGGQVMVTAPKDAVKGASASHRMLSQPASRPCGRGDWGLEPG